MGRNNSESAAPVVTQQRAGRLYKLLSLTAESARTRKALTGRLKVDVRGFYRDLELLRGLGVEVAYDGEKYRLTGELDDALARLPFPAGLSLRDAMTLARGSTEAHRRLKKKLDSFLGPNGQA
jgi:predicted DNA-binding transcriptional regulator YafY